MATLNIQRFWDISILTSLKRSKFSFQFILLSFILISSVSFVVPREYQKFMFFFYGMLLIYAALVYTMREAFYIAVGAFASHILSSWPFFQSLLKIGQFEEIVIEGIIVVLGYFLSCLFIGKILINERENQEKLIKMAKVNAEVAQELSSANEQISELYTNTIQTLAAAIDAKDPYTKGHSERVTNYAVAVAREMNLPEKEVQNIFYGAILHDIGKIGIHEFILTKPGPLTNQEFKKMERHPEIGAKILSSVPFLDQVIPIVLHHHEYFNGEGYPEGLRGHEIPLGARIISIVDTYDALTTDRPYRKSFDKRKALEVVNKGVGIQFDPVVFEVFSKVINDNNEITELSYVSIGFYGQDG